MEPAAFSNYLGQKLAAESRHTVATETDDGLADIPTHEPAPMPSTSDATRSTSAPVPPQRDAPLCHPHPIYDGGQDGTAARARAVSQPPEPAASASPRSRRGLLAGMETLRAGVTSLRETSRALGLSTAANAAAETPGSKAEKPTPEERWKGYFKRDIPVAPPAPHVPTALIPTALIKLRMHNHPQK